MPVGTKFYATYVGMYGCCMNNVAMLWSARTYQVWYSLFVYFVSQ